MFKKLDNFVESIKPRVFQEQASLPLGIVNELNEYLRHHLKVLSMLRAHQLALNHEAQTLDKIGPVRFEGNTRILTALEKLIGAIASTLLFLKRSTQQDTVDRVRIYLQSLTEKITAIKEIARPVDQELHDLVENLKMDLATISGMIKEIEEAERGLV